MRNEKVEKLKQLVPITEYARYLQYTVLPVGRYYTLAEHDSVRINPATNRFFRNSSSDDTASGSVINFAMYFGEMTYKEAVRDLEEFIGSYNLESRPVLRPEGNQTNRKKMLLLPPHGGSRRHAYAYLSKIRRIDPLVIDFFFASRRLYEDDKRNCVFVSYDEDTGRPDFACRRGTLSERPFKGDVPGCNYDHCFVIPAKGERLYVCEAVIDVMSLMTYFLDSGIDRKELGTYHFQALSSTRKYPALFQYLDRHPEIKEVYIALDHDQSGEETLQRILQTGKEKKITQKLIPFLPAPEGWDWNDVIRKGGM